MFLISLTILPSTTTRTMFLSSPRKTNLWTRSWILSWPKGVVSLFPEYNDNLYDWLIKNKFWVKVWSSEVWDWSLGRKQTYNNLLFIETKYLNSKFSVNLLLTKFFFKKSKQKTDTALIICIASDLRKTLKNWNKWKHKILINLRSFDVCLFVYPIITHKPLDRLLICELGRNMWMFLV